MAALILFAAALGGGFLFPWWWPAVAAYAVGCWLPRKGSTAFLSGFAGPAAAWAGLAAWYDIGNHQILSGRMAVLFHLPAGWCLILATGILAGLMGGLGAWAGQALRAYVRPHASGTAGTGSGTAAAPAAGNPAPGDTATAGVAGTGIAAAGTAAIDMADPDGKDPLDA